MHWSEPTTWKRVKENAREIDRVYRWRRMSVVSGSLALAACLGVRFLLPCSADVRLTAPMIMLLVCFCTFLPLVLFINALQTGGVAFRKKVLSVCDSFVRCQIPYEQIACLGFERSGDKKYFYVRGVPLRAGKDVEVHVALTAKYTQAEIEAYIVQRGLGHLLAATRELESPPVRHLERGSPETDSCIASVFGPSMLMIALGFFLCLMLAVYCKLSGCKVPGCWTWAFIVDELVYVQLFFPGNRLGDIAKLINEKRLSVHQARKLAVAQVPLLALFPPSVFVVLWLIGLSPAIVWTSSAIWQLAWMALVYGMGRMFRKERLESNLRATGT